MLRHIIHTLHHTTHLLHHRSCCSDEGCVCGVHCRIQQDLKHLPLVGGAGQGLVELW